MDNKGQLPKAQVLNLKDYIIYSDDSIVSKTLLNKQAGTVTLFAFDKGQGLSEHKASYDAMVYILDGSAQIIIAGKPQNASAGEIIVMPADVPHAIKAQEKFKMLLVMIRS